MKKFFGFVFVALLPYLASAQSIVGSWQMAGTENDLGQAVATLTFNDDGTFVRESSQSVPGPDGKLVTGRYHEEGKWKLSRKGKKIRMHIKPSSIRIDTGQQGATAVVGKTVEALRKFDVFPTIYSPKIVSLTQDELVLLEIIEEDDYDDTQVVDNVRYLRVQAQ